MTTRPFIASAALIMVFVFARSLLNGIPAVRHFRVLPTVVRYRLVPAQMVGPERKDGQLARVLERGPVA